MLSDDESSDEVGNHGNHLKNKHAQLNDTLEEIPSKPKLTAQKIAKTHLKKLKNDDKKPMNVHTKKTPVLSIKLNEIQNVQVKKLMSQSNNSHVITSRSAGPKKVEINLGKKATEELKNVNINQSYQNLASSLRGERNNRFLKTIISQGDDAEITKMESKKIKEVPSVVSINTKS